MKYVNSFEVFDKKIGLGHDVYFIADIAANHDGDLQRALDLIHLAKEAGANCAKFQHFTANNIVSDLGFKKLDADQLSHQQSWSDSVYEVYDKYHARREWNNALVDECKKIDIHFMTTPYDLDALQMFEEASAAFKIGSGDITFKSFIAATAEIGKPVFLATGASNFAEVSSAVGWVLEKNQQICLMQCNTNYTGDPENFRFVNLNVLSRFKETWPEMPLGLSDHTPGHAAVLGAVALGARAIEKHFTDDNSRQGPDHKFALNPITWREMVDRCRELEMSLGDGIKRVEANERNTVIIQRRALRLIRDKGAGEIIEATDLEALRPCPEGACRPDQINEVCGRLLNKALSSGEELYWENLV